MSAYVQSSLTNSQSARSVAEPAKGWFARLVSTLRLWRRRVRERRALAELTQRELADFGATNADVYRELRTPFWMSLPPC
jgi:uncharacterized protein YjiS (DUF1127 family)